MNISRNDFTPPLLFALYSIYITELLARLRLYCRPQLIGQQSRGFAGVCDLHSKMDPHWCKIMEILLVIPLISEMSDITLCTSILPKEIARIDQQSSQSWPDPQITQIQWIRKFVFFFPFFSFPLPNCLLCIPFQPMVGLNENLPAILPPQFSSTWTF